MSSPSSSSPSSPPPPPPPPPPSSSPSSLPHGGGGLLCVDKPLRVACVGGGQLGRMMALEAPRLNIEMSFLDPGGLQSPAGQVVPSNRILQGGLKDAYKIRQLATGNNNNTNTGNDNNNNNNNQVDVVTVEIEHIDVGALYALEQKGVNVQPSARVLELIQDKLLQKQHFSSQQHNIPLPKFCATPSVAAIQQACHDLGLPLMLKTRRGGYDGRGNAVLKSSNLADIFKALQELGINTPSMDNNNDDAAADADGMTTAATDLDLYAEGWIDFECEVAVMVVRSANNKESVSYPVVNAIQQNSICRIVLVPARKLSEATQLECQRIAMLAVDSLGEGASGMFGVEMFVTKNNTGQVSVLLNEVAPRPHNTGHYTQNACSVNQFENHLRAICGLPLGSTELSVQAAAMVNVLGATSGTWEDTVASSNAAMTMPRTTVHWYGKEGCRPGRKMGHINLTGDSHAELDNRLRQLMALEVIPESLLPSSSSSSSSTGTTVQSPPLVGIVMGSHSDLPTMNAAVDILKKFGVAYEVDIVSAHRTPDKLLEYSRSAAGRGIRVIIAGAGGAAHLPGMIASMTPLPVVGVPVKTSTLSGIDSLYSIVQMPRGVPVATVAIGNAMNAGLLAVRILAASRPSLRQQMKDYQQEMSDSVHTMSAKLLDLGSDAFLEQMDNKNQAVNV